MAPQSLMPRPIPAAIVAMVCRHRSRLFFTTRSFPRHHMVTIGEAGQRYQQMYRPSGDHTAAGHFTFTRAFIDAIMPMSRHELEVGDGLALDFDDAFQARRTAGIGFRQTSAEMPTCRRHNTARRHFAPKKNTSRDERQRLLNAALPSLVAVTSALYFRHRGYRPQHRRHYAGLAELHRLAWSMMSHRPFTRIQTHICRGRACFRASSPAEHSNGINAVHLAAKIDMVLIHAVFDDFSLADFAMTRRKEIATARRRHHAVASACRRFDVGSAWKAPLPHSGCASPPPFL